ncbi:PTS transporter subunit EIIC [Spiroplasma sp. AdecLV25b]|uniref:PTS sugar transporter subunit IIC n=1 Tax=Spiroplasma sp. AdecLV25b TaxID=3027162 RepID=UPI0027DFC1C4|nr:PTS transporter subunit EIIC [Spiroplasma sp. AdecLV25b]
MGQKLNQKLPVNRQINLIMVGFAASSSLFMMSVGGIFALDGNGNPTENFASIFIGNLGSTGMLTAIIIGLILPWIFYLPVRFNWTIRLPKVVPQGVSQSFADIIPYGLSVMVFWGFGYIFIQFLGMSFTDALFSAIKPVFSGLDSYGFLAVMSFFTSLIWFIGIHGPSVTRPFLTPFMYNNLADNQALFAQGLHSHWALTYEFSYDFSSTLGGTGTTFVVPLILILFCKSKQLKIVGFASYIPIWFQVNEPALFGVPLILNPIVFIPFTIIPIINVELYKMFIDVFGMNGAIADVPWSMPAIIGLELGTGLQGWQPALLWIIMCTIDFVLWIPFLLVFDRLVCKDEILKAETEKLIKPLHYNYWSIFQSWLVSKTGFNKNIKGKYQLQYQQVMSDIKIEKYKKQEFKEILKKQELLNKKDTKIKVINAQKHVLIICYGVLVLQLCLLNLHALEHN